MQSVFELTESKTLLCDACDNYSFQIEGHKSESGAMFLDISLVDKNTGRVVHKHSNTDGNELLEALLQLKYGGEKKR